MPDLIAEGADPTNRWRRALPVGRAVMLGRSGEWSAPWDPLISRCHAELCCRDGVLAVQRVPDARNPIFYRGRPVERLTLKPGEHFVIAATRFTFVDEQAVVTLDVPRPDSAETFTAEDLKRLRFRDAQQRIDMLSRLPELIAGAESDPELYARLVNVLLVGIRPAAAAAVVAIDPEPPAATETLTETKVPAETEPPAHVAVLHWDRRRPGGGFAPSQRLIAEATRRGQSVLHVWKSGGKSDFTAAEQADWAFCTPLSGEACRGWALYVEGRFAADGTPQAVVDPSALRDDLKFSELVATTVAAWRDNQRLRERHAGLRPFFSPRVLEAIARDDPQKVLAPRETDVTVMFCDLRGFSGRSERESGDLVGLLERVSRALGVTTQHILDHGGVVGDFQGDAVMGFWGWPLAQPDRAVLACQAALGIQAQFSLARHRSDHPLADFHMGIGIASGLAVAGRIGTVDQAKVTVFGPVANLASRLEGMTRTIGADILVDEATATAVSTAIPSIARTRSLATIRPYGLEMPVLVSQLLPLEAENPEFSAARLEAFAGAQQAFSSGDWEEARRGLSALPEEDRAARFLLAFIDEHGGRPPTGWDGVIRLTSK